jgi:arylsulfatase
MPDARPNILLILTDQQRGDCLGLDGHAVLQTPNLDWLGRSGAFFRRAWSECPSCIPARRVLMSGQAPSVNGMVGMTGEIDWEPPATLAGELSSAGYQSEMIGKMHLHPPRKRYGFDHMQLSNGTRGMPNEYEEWLKRQGYSDAPRPGVAHGVSGNGWVGRPNYLPEEMTHTFWCVSRSLEFLERRDPTCPFFLNVSFIDPHPPLTPPRHYYDRYIGRDLPMPVVGDWAKDMPGPVRGLDINAWDICLDHDMMRAARAAYFGMINFVDDQVGRLFNGLRDMGLMNNTFVLFTSDHGEMLGDHNMYRKTFAYEGSARVPFLAWAPPGWDYPAEVATCAPVGWQDVMPTLLDAADVPIPDSVTGRSVLPLMRGEDASWRDVLHGEHAGHYDYEHGVHFLSDGHRKYIWYSQTGREHLFDLFDDPNEMHDLALTEAGETLMPPWRARLAAELKDRPEGFSDGERLIIGRPHDHMVRVAG